MNKKTYFTIGALATVIAIVLDRMTGQSFSCGPIAVIYMGFFITLQVSYQVTNHHSVTYQQ